MKSDDEKIAGELEKSDRVGDASEALQTLLGGGLAFAASGYIAAATGLTTIPILTTVGGWVGLTILSATPLPWVIGATLAGALVVNFIGKLIRSGGRNDQIGWDIAERLRNNLSKRNIQEPTICTKIRPDNIDALRDELKIALEKKLIEKTQAERLALLVSQGKLNVDIAIRRIRAINEAGN